MKDENEKKKKKTKKNHNHRWLHKITDRRMDEFNQNEEMHKHLYFIYITYYSFGNIGSKNRVFFVYFICMKIYLIEIPIKAHFLSNKKLVINHTLHETV